MSQLEPSNPKLSSHCQNVPKILISVSQKFRPKPNTTDMKIDVQVFSSYDCTDEAPSTFEAILSHFFLMYKDVQLGGQNQCYLGDDFIFKITLEI